MTHLAGDTDLIHDPDAHVSEQYTLTPAEREVAELLGHKSTGEWLRCTRAEWATIAALVAWKGQE